MRVLCLSFFFVMHYFVSILVSVVILKRKRKRVALLLLSSICIVTINILWLFLAGPWVGLQCVIVVFSHHTDLLFQILAIISQTVIGSPEKRHLTLLK